MSYNLTCESSEVWNEKDILCRGARSALDVSAVFAHHSFAAEYDENKVVTITGPVTDFKWTNPHAWLYIEGKDESGKVTTWGFEMASPNGLVHRGWKREDLKKGDLMTVDGFRAKDGSNTANARTVILSDGRKLFGGFNSTPGAPAK